MEQAHADESLVVIDALDDVSAQLELGHDCGREVNPAGVKLGRRPAGRRLGAVALAAAVAGRQRASSTDCRLRARLGRVERFQAALLHWTFGDWRLVAANGCVPAAVD
jgi:hypothetical protein